MSNVPNVQPSTMFIRDNLEIMRGMDDECIDLIYLDPPFNSKHNYAAPIGSEAAGAEFKDIWSLSDVDVQWIGSLQKEHPNLHAILKAVSDDSDKSYLAYMAMRLLEMRRILKDTGSLYLHCDPTMSHYVKIVMDVIFGRSNFRNEIIWAYTQGGRGLRDFARKHDVILRYAKSNQFLFNSNDVRISYELVSQKSSDSFTKVDENGRSYKEVFGTNRKKKYRYYKDAGKLPYDWWTDISQITGRAAAAKNTERTSYPTQKLLKLLERIIKASSNAGDWVMDPFCGCATTCVAAHLLGRKWIGIDVSLAADILVRKRIDKELRNDWVASGQAVYEPITTSDIPVRSGAKVVPKEYKPILYGDQQGNCNLCGVHFEFRNLTIDHIVPKSKGGQDLETNLQLLCQACNSSKGARDMVEMQALFSSYVPTQSIHV